MIRDTEPYHRSVSTRWSDNDMYGHLNNNVYYSAMDTVINTWMIEEAGLDPLAGPALGVCVSSGLHFKQSASFPEEIAVELGVGRIGTSSVTWTPRILRVVDNAELATGEFVTVFIDRAGRRPVAIPTGIRIAIESAFAVPQI
jgi:acyl-CoA thioester hydrolase